MELDLGYAQALPVLPFQAEHIKILLVGLGGTGSFLARHVACMVWMLRDAGKDTTLSFIDPDIVEAGNIPRQNFCPAEIGRYKAEALAQRYARDFGVEIGFVPSAFSPDMVEAGWNMLTVLVGSVDNAKARATLDATLQKNERIAYSNSPGAPRIWYLDLGNGLDHGQVLLGSTMNIPTLASAFAIGALSRCSLLPSPLLQEPNLRQPRPEELTTHQLSCAELLAANAQSMTINSAMAIEAADYLYRLLITGNLKKFATYLDLSAGTKRSHYTTPQAVANVLGCEPSFFHQAKEVAAAPLCVFA
jgi:PRTRC genetic system ThiF family protein